MISDSNLEIKFHENTVVIRTVDRIGYPVDVWVFHKDRLSKNEKVFIDNILSMSKSMTSDQDKKKDEQ